MLYDNRTIESRILTVQIIPQRYLLVSKCSETSHRVKSFHDRSLVNCDRFAQTAVIRGTLLGIQQMQKDAGGKGGVIVNVSSVAGLYSLSQLPVYSATEHAVVCFSRSFAVSPGSSQQLIVLNSIVDLRSDDFAVTLSLREDWSKDNGPVP